MDHNYKTVEELPVTLNAEDIRVFLRISRAQSYALLNSYQFPTLHIGKRLIVPKERFIEWMNKNCASGVNAVK